MQGFHRDVFKDKSSWGEGPWITEPDAARWTDEETGYLCAIERNPSGGYLCGYVGVTENHALFGKDWLDEAVRNLRVRRDGVTMVWKSDRGPAVQWFGFDCGRVGDLSPADKALGMKPVAGDEYRERDYVKEEVSKLARELRQLEDQEEPGV